MMRFMLLFSRQGKLRLQKWYTATAERDKKKMVRELMQVVLARKPKMCSFLEWRDLKIVYKRYSLPQAGPPPTQSTENQTDPSSLVLVDGIPPGGLGQSMVLKSFGEEN
ncbi:hypothetical protein J4Q44_G00057650 [Coregonus suidteri]|uniref:AP complex mu/sigma subunit domain-containing protein n=1 Tax=Coregonus suidteri TaxID=861788 RepID=A0AAN8MCR2_9TELE